MSNIKEILDVFISDVLKFKQEINQEELELNFLVEQLANEKVNFAKQKEALAVREEAVSEIEDVVAYKDDAKKLLKEATDKMGDLTQSKDAFENYKNEKMKEIHNTESKLNEDGKYIKKEYEALNKERELLKQDKETYKDKVAKSIVDLANKK